MDVGRDYAHVGQIFPFKDRPDVGIKVLFYPVPLTRDAVPFPNPFVLRNWDIREGLPQTPLGTDQSFKVLFLGKKPTNPQGTVCGSADLWANGLDYATWLAGGYACTCMGADCGIWSEVCQTLLPKRLNVSGMWQTTGPTFTTTADWQPTIQPNTWSTPPVRFHCNGTFHDVVFSLVEDTGQPGWDLIANGSFTFCDPVQCKYPQSFAGSTGELFTCPPPWGFGPTSADVVFTAP